MAAEDEDVVVVDCCSVCYHGFKVGVVEKISASRTITDRQIGGKQIKKC